MVSDGGIVVRGERRGSVHLLVPVGELDVATVAVLDRAFQAVHGDDDVAMIVVDLTELRFMDSTGIGLLVRMNDACEDADRLRVINGSASVVKLLDITGVRRALPIISREDNPSRKCTAKTDEHRAAPPHAPVSLAAR
jgi:anti-anti-sigma factor